MITFEEARKIALENIGADCELINGSIIEKPYGWYFNFQSKKYLESGNYRNLMVGGSGFLVERESGGIVEFGSAYSPAQNFEIYEKGLCGKNDLIVLKVKEPHETIRLLNRLQMVNFEAQAVSDFAPGVKPAASRIYNEKQIKEAITQLPCIFKNQSFYFALDEFRKIDESKAFDYELRKKSIDRPE